MVERCISNVLFCRDDGRLLTGYRRTKLVHLCAAAPCDSGLLFTGLS